MIQQDSRFLAKFFGMLIGLFVVMVLLIILANALYKESASSNVSKDPMVQAAIEARIKPVGAVNIAGESSAGGAPSAAAAATPAAGPALTGQQIVQQTCAACHGTGVMGAPKIGNKADWEPRIKKGLATLLNHAEHGFKQMPARGGKPSLTNDDLKHAIAYMLSKVGVQDAFGAEAKAAAPAKTAAPVKVPAASPAKAAAPAAAASGGVDLAKGKKVVQGTCFACHGTGVMGAPKIGNKADWAPRIKKGIAMLLDHAEHGFKAMPAHGGNPGLTNAELKDAIEYMISQSK